MAYPTQFPEWLSYLSSIGQRLDLPPLRLGVAYNFTLDIEAHAVLEDWTDGAFSMQGKSSPGANTALVTFDISAGVPSGLLTPVTVEAGVTEQDDIPDPGETGISALYYDILYTPTGFDPVLVSGGVLPVIAGVTE